MFGLNLPRICRAHWPKILVSAAISTGIALAIASTMPKVYQGRARVEADYFKEDPITHRYLPKTVVERYNATQDAIITDSIVAEPVAKAMGFVEPPKDGNFNSPDYLWRLRQATSVVRGQTGIKWSEEIPTFEIVYSSSSPVQAARGATLLRETYLQKMLDIRHKNDRLRLAALREESDKLSAALDAATDRKRAFEKANGVHLFDDNTDATQIALRSMSSGQAAFRGERGSQKDAPHIDYGSIAKMDAQLATAQMKLGPNHPQVILLRAQRDAVFARATSNVGAVRMPPAKSSELSAQTAKFLRERDKLDGARRIANEIDLLSQQARALSSEIGEVQQRLGLDFTGLRAVGEVEVPKTPVRPILPLIGTLAFLFGLVFGVQASVIVELLNRRVRGVDDLESLDVPVLVAYNSRRVIQNADDGQDQVEAAAAA